MRPAKLRSDRYLGMALVWVVLLIAGGLAVMLLGESAERRQMARQGEAQARLLAEAIAAPLAFDDMAGVRDYITNVQVNPNVLGAGVYDAEGRMVASVADQDEGPQPSTSPLAASTWFADGRLFVIHPVEQAGQQLGAVRLRLEQQPLAQRLARYAGFGLIILLAAFVVVVLAVAQSALRRANAQLAARARELGEANDDLQAEMLERAKAEEALRQGQKMEAIGRMTGGVAHDFNNLLMAISSGVELLERTTDEKRRATLREGVRQAVDRGAGLTSRLLAFSRTTPLQSEVIDLKERVEGMKMLLERSLRQDIELLVDLPDDLWPVEVDVGELELALLNLAVNARDAMPSGGRLMIQANNATGETMGEHVELRVSDTGEGISPDALNRVFEPFYTTKEVGRGTGLGLSQVYGFARSSGGEASISSEPGEGAAITLCLPRSHKTPVAPQKSAARTAQRGEGRILLVEDDDAVAEGVGHMLRDLGYSYVRASNGSEALVRLEREGPFDLVLSDMVMPGGLDGLSLAKAVRESRPELPVLLTTGYSESAARVKAEHIPLLLKPYRLDALAEAIEVSRSH